MTPQHFEGGRFIFGGNHHAETAAHVEDLVHLLVRHAGPLGDQLEDRLGSKRVGDLIGDLGLQPEQVVETAGSDVGEAVDPDRGGEQPSTALT